MAASESRNVGRGPRVALDGDLDLRRARDIRALLQDALIDRAAVEIDVSGLTGIDVGVLQLLISARKSAEQHGMKLSLDARSSTALQAALVSAGLVGPDGKARTPEEAFWFGGNGSENART
jgi:anti-anti-sigma regulatory factor